MFILPFFCYLQRFKSFDRHFFENQSVLSLLYMKSALSSNKNRQYFLGFEKIFLQWMREHDIFFSKL